MLGGWGGGQHKETAQSKGTGKRMETIARSSVPSLCPATLYTPSSPSLPHVVKHANVQTHLNQHFGSRN